MRVVPLFLIGVSVTLAGCRNEARHSATAKRAIRVAAAANLKFAFDEIVTRFQETHPGIEVSVTYGSSGNFFAQLSNRAPFDIFLSADVEYPRRLIGEGIAANNSEFLYAIGRIVVWVPNSSKLDVERLGIRALADPAVRKIAIANPTHAPYGRAAVSALKHFQLYDEVHTHLVYGENIEQATQFVQSEAADIGIVSLSLALSPSLKDKGRFWIVPSDACQQLEQAGLILSWTADKEAAERLRDFLLGGISRAILKRHGYELPASAAP